MLFIVNYFVEVIFFFYFRYFKDMVKGEILLVKERFEMLIVI